MFELWSCWVFKLSNCELLRFGVFQLYNIIFFTLHFQKKLSKSLSSLYDTLNSVNAVPPRPLETGGLYKSIGVTNQDAQTDDTSRNDVHQSENFIQRGRANTAPAAIFDSVNVEHKTSCRRRKNGIVKGIESLRSFVRSFVRLFIDYFHCVWSKALF